MTTLKMTLNWNKMDLDMRKYILQQVGFRLHLASRDWYDLDTWIRLQLNDHLLLRSNGTVGLSE